MDLQDVRKFRPNFRSVKSFKVNFFNESQLVISVLAFQSNEPIASDGGVSLVRKFIRVRLYKSEEFFSL